MNEIDPKALFRLSVLGPVVSREKLEHGELQQLIRELAQREYAIPGTQRRHLGEKTIQAWYYSWRREGIAGLEPKLRVDRGQSKIAPAIQEAILAAKRDNPRRSIRQILRLLEAAGLVAQRRPWIAPRTPRCTAASRSAFSSSPSWSASASPCSSRTP